MGQGHQGAEREAAAFSERLSELRQARRNLAAARDDEDHQVRRLKDSLERHGGRSPDAESRLSLLDEGRKLTAQALEKIDREIAELKRRLATLQDDTSGP